MRQEVMAAPATKLAESSGLQWDYGQIADETQQRALMRIAVDIKYRSERVREDLIVIGQQLRAARVALDHGQWQNWVEVEFGFTPRTARNLIHVSERFGDKPETVSAFSDSVLYLLAAPSTPDEAVISAEMQARAGETVTKAKAIEIINAHKTPPQPPEVWQIERAISDKLDIMAEMLPAGARERYRKERLLALKQTRLAQPDWDRIALMLPDGWRKREVMQAIANLLEQMHQEERKAEKAGKSLVEVLDAEPQLPEGWRIEVWPDTSGFVALHALKQWGTDVFREPDDARRAVLAEEYTMAGYVEWEMAVAEAAPIERVLDDGWQVRQDAPTGDWYAANIAGQVATARYETEEQARRAVENGDYTEEWDRYWWHLGCLRNVPPGDVNFKSALDNAEIATLQDALHEMPPEGNKVRIERIQARLKQRQFAAQEPDYEALALEAARKHTDGTHQAMIRWLETHFEKRHFRDITDAEMNGQKLFNACGNVKARLQREQQATQVPAPAQAAAPQAAPPVRDRSRYLRNYLDGTRHFRNVILDTIAEMTGEHVAANTAKRALDPLIAALERNLAAQKEAAHAL